MISFETAFDEEGLVPVVELADTAAIAIASGLSYENERNGSLQSISRLAQLYDIEKVLNSTLEMDELLPIIASKFAEILNVQAANVWMVGGDQNLILSHSSRLRPSPPAGISAADRRRHSG